MLLVALKKRIDSRNSTNFVHFFKGDEEQDAIEEALEQSMREKELEGERQMIFYFNEFVVEVKAINDNKTQLYIHEFEGNFTAFWHPPAKG